MESISRRAKIAWMPALMLALVARVLVVREAAAEDDATLFPVPDYRGDLLSRPRRT